MIIFRPLEEKDFLKMHEWLNADFVARFWKNPASIEDVKNKYGAYISGEKPTKPCKITVINGVKNKRAAHIGGDKR